MSSRQNSDLQYAAWLATQRGAPQLNTLSFAGGFDGFEGPTQGSRYGGFDRFDQFNRSSLVLPGSGGGSGGSSNSSSVLTPYAADPVDSVFRSVAQADHESLVRSGNEAYANALALHKGTKAELDSLRYVYLC